MASLAANTLEVRDAVKSYGDVKALQGVSMSIAPGQFMALLGPNGAGKSTLFQLIAGALNVSEGELHRDRRMRVGWFPQHQIEAMDPTDTPLEIIRRAMPEASESGRRS